jgi:hypothetical protein
VGVLVAFSFFAGTGRSAPVVLVAVHQSSGRAPTRTVRWPPEPGCQRDDGRIFRHVRSCRLHPAGSHRRRSVPQGPRSSGHCPIAAASPSVQPCTHWPVLSARGTRDRAKTAQTCRGVAEPPSPPGGPTTAWFEPKTNPSLYEVECLEPNALTVTSIRMTTTTTPTTASTHFLRSVHNHATDALRGASLDVGGR